MKRIVHSTTVAAALAVTLMFAAFTAAFGQAQPAGTFTTHRRPSSEIVALCGVDALSAS